MIWRIASIPADNAGTVQPFAFAMSTFTLFAALACVVQPTYADTCTDHYRLRFALAADPVTLLPGADSPPLKIVFAYDLNFPLGACRVRVDVDPKSVTWSIDNPSVASLGAACSGSDSCVVHGNNVGLTLLHASAHDAELMGLSGSTLKNIKVSNSQPPDQCTDNTGAMVPCGGGCITTASSASAVRLSKAVVSLAATASVPIAASCDPSGEPIEIIVSGDPNDNEGPQGATSLHYVNGAEKLSYSIYFDNQPTASAPTQTISVTDALNGSLVDFDSIILGPISFRDKIVTPPTAPLQSTGTYTTDIDLRPTVNLLVRVAASMNAGTGTLKWNLTSVDPATGKLPTDPTAGFLPPGQEGSVSFSVLPKPLSSGSVLPNKATIVFDVNAAIDTPLWSNTIDKNSPTSHVSALASSQSAASFPVRWSGVDTESGLASFDVWVSDNGASFTRWLSQTSALTMNYPGQAGHRYGFYSIARDQVGNIEAPKTMAEATTQVVIAKPPQVVVTHLLSRDSQNNVVTNLTLTNNGGMTARTTLITVATIGGTAASAIPKIPVDIAAGSSASAQVVFPATVGGAGSGGVLTIGGTYVGGSFSFSSRVTLP